MGIDVYTHMGVKTNDSLVVGEEGCKRNLFDWHKDFGKKYFVYQFSWKVFYLKQRIKMITQKEFNIDM
jgi:hypothetical protein